jgi:hypothetical protein
MCAFTQNRHLPSNQSRADCAACVLKHHIARAGVFLQTFTLENFDTSSPQLSKGRQHQPSRGQPAQTGIMTKVRILKTGKTVGGIPFTRGDLSHICYATAFMLEKCF